MDGQKQGPCIFPCPCGQHARLQHAYLVDPSMSAAFPPELEAIHGYFPELEQHQLHQFRHLEYLFRFWNSRVNLISKGDMEHFYERHILHSLAISRLTQWVPGTRILDVGTGGGFPGLPLAILFPKVEFVLCDTIAKKLRVVDVVARNLALQNVQVWHGPAEQAEGPFDFAVTRAVADMESLHRWTAPLLASESQNDLPNGLIALKGGQLLEELSRFGDKVYQFPIQEWFPLTWFKNKVVVYLPA